MQGKSRPQAFATALIIYFLALLGFVGVHRLVFGESLLLSTLWGDVAATVIVWLFGVYYKNSSLYDPYWSVAPLWIVPFWLVTRGSGLSFPEILTLTALYIWGIRLTLNWAVRWEGIKHQDWRYTQLRGQAPRWWIVTNLGGIHLMPTLLVFAGLVPVYVALFYPGPGTNPLLPLGFGTCITATALQAVADKQMDNFKKSTPPKDAYIDLGIWRYSRHPNYFGEILFWWGVWLMQMGLNPHIWITVAGPVLMTLLFACISIPMMEKHILETKPGYAQYQQKVSVLIPWFRQEAARPGRSVEG